MDEIEQKVIGIVAEEMRIDRAGISRSTRFHEDLSADSLDTIEMIMTVEEDFEISVDDADAEKLTTVGAAVDYVRARVREAGSV